MFVDLELWIVHVWYLTQGHYRNIYELPLRPITAGSIAYFSVG